MQNIDYPAALTALTAKVMDATGLSWAKSIAFLNAPFDKPTDGAKWLRLTDKQLTSERGKHFKIQHHMFVLDFFYPKDENVINQLAEVETIARSFEDSLESAYTVKDATHRIIADDDYLFIKLTINYYFEGT